MDLSNVSLSDLINEMSTYNQMEVYAVGKPVKLAQFDDFLPINVEFELICPSCNGAFMHRSGVTTGQYDHESISIMFDCEQCDAAPCLSLWNYKGSMRITFSYRKKE